MPFKREPGFKLPLTKFLPKEKFIQRSNYEVKEWLAAKKFRARALASHSGEEVKKIQKLAGPKKVLSVFELLRRQTEDLQFLKMCGPKLNLVPVFSYSTKSCHNQMCTDGEIQFVTRKGRRTVQCKLKLKKLPPSILNPRAPPRGQSIRLEVHAKIATSARLKEGYSQFLHSGGHLVDFITKKLWPALETVEKPPEKRSFAGEDRHHRSGFPPRYRPAPHTSMPRHAAPQTSVPRQLLQHIPRVSRQAPAPRAPMPNMRFPMPAAPNFHNPQDVRVSQNSNLNQNSHSHSNSNSNSSNSGAPVKRGGAFGAPRDNASWRR